MARLLKIKIDSGARRSWRSQWRRPHSSPDAGGQRGLERHGGSTDGERWREVAGPRRTLPKRSRPAARPCGPGSEMIVTGITLGVRTGRPSARPRSPRRTTRARTRWRQLPGTAEPRRTTAGGVQRGRASEMLVWGCGLTAYNPASKRVARLPDSPTRHGIVVWTGRELVGWGGGCVGTSRTTAPRITRARTHGGRCPRACQRATVAARGVDRSRARHLQRPQSGGRARWAARDTTRGRTRGGGSSPSGASALWAIAVYDGNEIHVLGARRGAVLSFNPSNNRWRTLPRTELAADGLVRCLDGEPSACLGSVHAGLRSREGSLDDLRVLTAGVPRGSYRPCGRDAS